MLKKIFILSLIVIVGACSGGGYSSNPWAGTSAASAAAAPPKALSAEADGKYNHVITDHEGRGEFDMAGLDYVPDANAPQNPYATMPDNMADQNVVRPIKVALLVPLSGPHKDLGLSFLQASQLAMFDMNFPAFEIMPRDTAGTPQTARAAAESAISDGAELILGPLFAASVKAAQPVAHRHNVNMIAFSTDWSLAGDNTYIMGFLPFAQVERVAEYATSQNLSRVGILAPNTDYGNAVVSAYNSMTYRAGIPRPEVARYSGDDNAISDTIRRFTNYDQRTAALEEGKEAPLPFDAILMPTGGDEARSVSNLLSFYDMDEKAVKRLGTGLWDDAGLASEQSMNHAWFAAPSPDLRRDFESRFRQLYGYSAPRIATLSYDATALAIVLARKGYQDGMFQNTGYGRDTIYSHNLISNPNGFAGIDGIFRFRPDNLVERGLAVLELSDGRVKVIDPAPTTFQRRSNY